MAKAEWKCEFHGWIDRIASFAFPHTKKTISFCQVCIRDLIGKSLPDLEPTKREKLEEARSQTCWHCKHFSFEPGCDDYSEDTPGDPMSVHCNKMEKGPDGNQRPRFIETDYISEKRFRQLIETAWTCPHFEEIAKA
jgi:hypothetical protein